MIGLLRFLLIIISILRSILDVFFCGCTILRVDIRSDRQEQNE